MGPGFESLTAYERNQSKDWFLFALYASSNTSGQCKSMEDSRSAEKRCGINKKYHLCLYAYKDSSWFTFHKKRGSVEKHLLFTCKKQKNILRILFSRCQKHKKIQKNRDFIWIYKIKAIPLHRQNKNDMRC